MKATGYIQIKAERLQSGGIKSLTPVRLTKGPPANPEPDSIVVKIEVIVPASAFEPYTARGEVPEGVKAVPMTVEDPNEEEAAAGPRLGEGEPALDRDDEERAQEPRCTAIGETLGEVCGLPAFGFIVMGGGKKRPMCEYHWKEDGSAHAKERIR